jgi:hypothetical protein
MKIYLFLTHGDTESEIVGPFKSHAKRDEAAKQVREDEGDECGIFMLDIGNDGVPECSDYSGGFFQDDDEDEEDDTEQTRRDEKNGLYPEHQDDAN